MCWIVYVNALPHQIVDLSLLQDCDQIARKVQGLSDVNIVTS